MTIQAQAWQTERAIAQAVTWSVVGRTNPNKTVLCMAGTDPVCYVIQTIAFAAMLVCYLIVLCVACQCGACYITVCFIIGIMHSERIFYVHREGIYAEMHPRPYK